MLKCNLYRGRPLVNQHWYCFFNVSNNSNNNNNNNNNNNRQAHKEGNVWILTRCTYHCKFVKLHWFVTMIFCLCRFMELNILETLLKILQSSDEETELPEQVDIFSSSKHWYFSKLRETGDFYLKIFPHKFQIWTKCPVSL